MTENNYYFNNTNGTPNSWGGSYTFTDNIISARIELESDKGKISPQLYFTYIKKKFGALERMRFEKRLNRIESAFDEAVENGQNILAEKILNNLAREMRESVIFAKEITRFIERTDLVKYKNKIKGGHVSDTLIKDYTRVIPKEITEKIKKLKDVFDNFVVYHYYESGLEEKREEKQKMSSEEKNKMRDPVLFGIIKETDRLYFIADWEDDYCDLTFDEIVDVIGSKELSKKPIIG